MIEALNNLKKIHMNYERLSMPVGDVVHSRKKFIFNYTFMYLFIYFSGNHTKKIRSVISVSLFLFYFLFF